MTSVNPKEALQYLASAEPTHSDTMRSNTTSIHLGKRRNSEYDINLTLTTRWNSEMKYYATDLGWHVTKGTTVSYSFLDPQNFRVDRSNPAGRYSRKALDAATKHAQGTLAHLASGDLTRFADLFNLRYDRLKAA